MTGQTRVVLSNGEVLVGHPTGFPTEPTGGRLDFYVYGEGERHIPLTAIRRTEDPTSPVFSAA